MKIGIIGGGASGMLCAILIKKYNPNCDVTILEQNDRIGKKLLVTGNGMCNLENIHSNDTKFYNNACLGELLNKFNYKVVLKVFEDLGLLTMTDNEGRIYPYARKASNVLDILLLQLKMNQVNITTNYCVKTIKPLQNQYVINGEQTFDYVVLACGGLASINKEYYGKSLARSLGFKWVEALPSLTGFKTKESVKALSGIRLKASVDFLQKSHDDDYQIIDSSKGEIIFKDDGISGIVILELSRHYNPLYQNKICLDLMQDYSELELLKIIQSNYHQFLSLSDSLLGLVPKMVALDVIKKGNNDSRKVAHLLKHYELHLVSPYDFSQSQVMRGGIDLNDLNLDSFESKEHKNFYCIGECTDVDGSCGGFNLHFAWVSAIVSAKAILEKLRKYN